MINATAQLADALDEAGLRSLGTGVLNDRRQFTSLMVAAMQRLNTENDNQTNQGTP